MRDWQYSRSVAVHDARGRAVLVEQELAVQVLVALVLAELVPAVVQEHAAEQEPVARAPVDIVVGVLVGTVVDELVGTAVVVADILVVVVVVSKDLFNVVIFIFEH